VLLKNGQVLALALIGKQPLTLQLKLFLFY